MKLFEENFYRGYKLSNCSYSFYVILNKIAQKEFKLIKNENGNFFFYNKADALVYYFINDIKKYDLKANYIKILGRMDTFLKHGKFLKLNNYQKIISHKEMKIKINHNFEKFYFIQTAQTNDFLQIYTFLKKYFPKYLFYFSPQMLRDKIHEILVYKENNVICGALVYTQNFNSSFLDFIAVDSNLTRKNIGFALLSSYLSQFSKNTYCKLFVDESNLKVINFYKRAGYLWVGDIEESIVRLNFYKNFANI